MSDLLRVENLAVRFVNRRRETVEAVRGISFTMAPGEILGIVGESGSGKTVTTQAICGAIHVPGAAVSGRCLFAGQDMLTASPEEKRQILGKRISMVFQEPQSAMNPLLKVGRQVEEVLKIHTHQPKHERREAALDALEAVELADPERVYGQYPHELSGGMRQRALIAGAILLGPELLICDEPTSALDVTTQAQILALLQKINRDLGVGILLISHDLGVVRRLCRRILVMKAGQIVEEGTVEQVFEAPQHAYTQELLRASRGEL
ncbi:MAG: ABC transporter ATP-binding protein [Oscillospiraceae bacterium]|nr:ABC transporter ATP-binding protein [Oscillospiraceae bacterium]